MKKILTIFVALIATLSLWAGNTITYTAAEKLTETTDANTSGLHPRAFNVSITSHTFSDGTGIIMFRGEVTSIGYPAFYKCSGLTSVTIPNSVTSIGNSAFSDCSGLTSITIPNSVTSIGHYAFFGCSGLTSVTIGNSVTSIGGSAFEGCSGLTSITIPNSVTSIGWAAFVDCSGLTSVTIGNSVTSIDNYTFRGCSSLTSIVIESGNTKYDSRDNCNAIIAKSTNTLIFGCQNTVIPNSVRSIGSSAFFGCSGLTSVTIPSSVTSIGSNAFYGCSGLTSITIPSSVTSIGDYAFVDCSGLSSIVWNAKYCSSTSHYELAPFSSISSQITDFTLGEEVESVPSYLCYRMNKLTSITIPNSVTSIGDWAFSGCSGLTSITSEAVAPPSCGLYCFSYVDHSIPVYVPAASVGAYKTAAEWKDFTNIQATTTPLDNTSIEMQVHKVIIDGQVFVLRGDKTYTVEGVVVE